LLLSPAAQAAKTKVEGVKTTKDALNNFCPNRRWTGGKFRMILQSFFDQPNPQNIPLINVIVFVNTDSRTCALFAKAPKTLAIIEFLQTLIKRAKTHRRWSFLLWRNSFSGRVRRKLRFKRLKIKNLLKF
jgi:hypothetical protein